MRKEETVSSGQMACLFLSFTLGSAVINIPQPLTQSGNSGAWLSVIIANGFGMFLLACILYLYRKNPDFTFIDYSRKILGKWITLCISIPILLLLFLILSYIVIDIGGFFTSAMLRETPPYVFHVLILLVAAMTARAGMEVMARMFVLLLCYLIIFSLMVIVLNLPNYHLGYLLPVFPAGMKPVIHSTYMVLGFPYGEIVFFSLLLPFIQKEKNNSIKKYMFLALLIQGFLLILSILCTIMALGSLSGTFKFSLFQLARLVNIREIITRIESFIGIALIVGSYMKTSIMLFILKETLSRVLGLKDERIIIFPVMFISLLLTLTMFKSEIEFFEAVFVVLPLIMIIVAVLPLLLITIIVLFTGKKIERKDETY
ncbi:spore germination protein KB [Neobacillus niacini]|uniref:GerAB/ArcD/ProY family transporter n=1 Tax=Neobacillus niacini TaxID=86668 RepID=UPI00278B7442|nr:endospore germination permease [Neobacillus niacini]MDQ1005280.1 spore germination protein KB [Neobacillus niacini]